MKAAYFIAAIPEPFRILGLKLKPLSLGRYRLMRRFDCAFVAEENAEASITDLVLGVLICSMRCDEFLDFAEREDFQKQIKRWLRKASSSKWIGFVPWVGRRWRERYSFNVLEKVSTFKRYIDEGSVVPEYIEEKDGGASGAHWCQLVEHVLRAEVGWSKEEINEQPLTKAFSDYFTWAESQGSIRLGGLTDEEKAMGEANARIFEAMETA